jgi:GTP:adenosylcobinamide-phosphate guanylyltransferase
MFISTAAPCALWPMVMEALTRSALEHACAARQAGGRRYPESGDRVGQQLAATSVDAVTDLSHRRGIGAGHMAAPVPSDPVDDLSANAAPVRLVVLAGRRADTADALAERFGVSHRCIVPLAGQPLIARVLRTGAAHPRITSLAVSIERDSFDAVWDALTCLPGRGTVALVEAGDDLASSIRAAAQGWEGAIVVTTADHALLSAGAIDAVLAALDGADVALALVPQEAVAAVHHAATVLTLPLYEGAFAPCDLYALAGPHAIGAVEVPG